MRGAAQIRQSAGNRTAKRLSAARLAQVEVLRGTTDSPAPATLLCLARIRSSILLKTASSRTTPGEPCPGGPFPKPLVPKAPYLNSITALPPLGNVTTLGSGRLWQGMQSASLRQPVLHRHKNETVIAAEAFTATDRLQQEKGQDEAFCECPASRTEPHFAAAITAVERRVQDRAIDRHTAPRGIRNNEGAEQISNPILRRPARTS